MWAADLPGLLWWHCSHYLQENADFSGFLALGCWRCSCSVSQSPEPVNPTRDKKVTKSPFWPIFDRYDPLRDRNNPSKSSEDWNSLLNLMEKALNSGHSHLFAYCVLTHQFSDMGHCPLWIFWHGNVEITHIYETSFNLCKEIPCSFHVSTYTPAKTCVLLQINLHVNK